MSLTKFINILDAFAPLLPLIAFFFRRRLMVSDPGLRFILAYFSVQLLFNSASSILEYFLVNNYFIYKLNTLFSFVLLSFYFRRQISLLIPSPVFFTILFLYGALWSVSCINGEGIYIFNSYTLGLCSFIITIYALLYMYEQFNHPSKESLLYTYTFWIIVGIFTYYAAGFIIFLSSGIFIKKGAKALGTIWRFQNILLLIMCLYSTFGLIWKRYQKIQL